jgi:dTDP-L-rhamnose 4-epimerase
VRVLVTGAAGFIGSAVTDLLVADDHEVVGVDAMIPEAHRSRTPPDRVTTVDIRDRDALLPLLAGVDAVSHQAAMVGAGIVVADLPSYAGHNDLGTAVLLAAMQEAGVGRLVLASSMVVYGEGRHLCPVHGERRSGPRHVGDLEAGRFDNRCDLCREPMSWALVEEDAPVDPRSAYAASKVAQEHYASSWARQTGGAAIALRYHNVYGPRMPRDTPYSGVAALFRSAVDAGRVPEVFEDGGQMRDFVHVSDVARANLLALKALDTSGFAAFNVCSGTPVSIGEVAALVAAADGTEPMVTGRYRLGDVRHVVASPAKAAKHLGFRGAVGPDAGLTAFATDPLRG